MLDFGNKVENEGANAKGRLTVAEFNTLISAVNQNASDIDNIRQTYSMTSGLSIGYDNLQRVIVLQYTKSGVTTTLATVNADDFVIGGSLTSASYETEDGEGNSGEFLKLEFSTEQTVYINLTPIVGAALTLINSRLSALEGTNVFLTEAQYEALLEKDPDKRFRNGKELLAISFPGEFELLRGITIIEAERMLENEARRTDAPNSQRILTDPHMLDSTAAEGCYVMRGGFYLNKLLTDDRYYQETKPGTFSLLLTSDHPAESAANLMLCQEISGKRQLDITERLYGFKKKTFSLPLSQWLAFCHHAGCRLYFGVQKISAGSIKATVIAVNDTENYNHVLTAEIPLSTLDDDEGKVSAHLSCYLPMHNVRNLFGQDKTSRKKKLSL